MNDSTDKVLQAVTLGSVSVAGFFINTLVLLVFYKRPALRSPSNRFVLSLVAANFLALVGLAPVLILQVLLQNLRSWVHCIGTLTATTSVFSILAIAVDRYNAVLMPLHYSMTFTSQRSRGMIVAVWCLSTLLSLPPVLGFRRFESVHENDILHLSYTVVLVTLGFVVPLFALIWVYARMYTAAHRNSERTRRQSLQTNAGDVSRGGSLEAQYPPVMITPEIVRSEKPPMLSQIHKRRYSNTSISAILFREEGRAVKTAVMVVASFTICWAPFFFELLVGTLNVEPPVVVNFLVNFLLLMNTILSPFIYVFRNEVARNEAVRILFWWRSGLYQGNVLQHASREMESKTPENGIRIRRQPSSNCDSMSVQSFQLPMNYSTECKQCAEISLPPIADFVATYEIADVSDDAKVSSVEEPNESKHKTRGESVTFKLAFLPQRRCQTCIRQNSDSSSGSGYPLLRESESPTPNLSLSGKRHEMISRASSGEDSPTLRRGFCDSPKQFPNRCERDEIILEHEEHADAVRRASCDLPKLLGAKCDGDQVILEQDQRFIPISGSSRKKGCDLPKQMRARCDMDEVIHEHEGRLSAFSDVIYQFQETNMETGQDSTWVSIEDVADAKRRDPTRQDSDVTVDSGVDIGIDRSHSSSSSLSAISPVATRPKRHRHKLQRLAAVEDEDSLNISPSKNKMATVLPPYEFG